MASETLSKEEKALLRDFNRKTKNEKENVVHTSFFETDTFILEQICPITNDTTTHTTHTTLTTETNFLFYDKSSASIDYLDSYKWHDITIEPIRDNLLSSGVVILPSGIEEYGETKDLINEIHEFLFENFEVNGFYEEFLPYVILFYWVYERFPFVPYIHLVGLTGTGKTTAQEVLGSICYKPIDASGAITMSPIFRTASTWKGTLLLDEFEPNSEGYSEMIAFLKSGVGNKAVLRTEGDKKREVMTYMIKSPKVFTSEIPFSNAGLRSRMFVIQMDKNKRRIPLYRLKKFDDMAMRLRNKLLLWRLRHLNKIDLTEIEYGFPELTAFDGRVQQVITPIYYLSDEDTKKTILEFAQIQEAETKQERLDSLEGQIFQAIYDKLPNGASLKDIKEKINEDRSRRPITERKIASVIHKLLHFNIKRLGDANVSTVMSDEKPERVKEMASYYGLPYPPDSVVSVVSVVNDGLGRSDDQKVTTHINEESEVTTHMDPGQLYYSDLAEKDDTR